MGNQILQRPVAVQHNVRELRLAAGLSQEIAAERFDLASVSGRPKKHRKILRCSVRESMNC